jgi:hypothetical protein
LYRGRKLTANNAQKGFDLEFSACELIEDAFYVVTHLFNVTLPCCIAQLPAFVHEFHKLYFVRHLLENQCIKQPITSATNKEWHRETLGTPIFEEYIATGQSRFPLSRKRSRDSGYVDK